MAEAINLSVECDPLLCYPCSVGGKSRSAHGFCDTCNHHLCESCFKVHCVPLICRDHVMLDQVSMPKDKVVPHDPLTEQCKKHGRLLEYYCKKHKDILCSVCVTLNHGNCGVSFIPDEIIDIGNSREFSSLCDNMSELIERVKKNKQRADVNKSDIEQLKEEARSQVRHMKEELVKFFDKLELSLVREIDQIAVSDIQVMDKISKSCVTMETDLQKLSAELDEKLNKNQNNKLFVAMKKTEKKMAEIQSEIESIHSRNVVTRYRFEPDVNTIRTLGKLHVRRHDFKLKGKHERNIKVISMSDKAPYFISGICVLDQDKVFLCDFRNKSFKLVDTKRNEIVSEIRLPSRPWDTALVPRDVTEESTTRDLIVTMPGACSLRYIRVTNDQITDTDKVISVEGRCQGIQITQDRKLAVSYYDLGYNPVKVEILDMDGQVLRRLQTDHNGARLFHHPYYLAVSPGSGILYVSDEGNNTLTSISTRDGSVMTKLEGLVNPQGVTVDRAGSVFVCCKNGTVHLVAATGDRSTQILGKEDGLCEYPHAIGLSPEGDRMYVSGYRSDHVQEFLLTEN